MYYVIKDTQDDLYWTGFGWGFERVTAEQYDYPDIAYEVIRDGYRLLPAQWDPKAVKVMRVKGG